MTKFQIDSSPVYCLHIRKYRETSTILACFSKQFGRLDMIGKGMYRPKNKSELPQYFHEYRLSGIGRSELGILTGLESSLATINLTGNPWLVGCYCNELLLKFLPAHEPVTSLYAQYAAVINDLRNARDHQINLLWFEKNLIESLGYGINFFTDCGTDDLIEHNKNYIFETAKGFSQSSENAPNMIPGFVIMALAQNTWSEKEDEFFNAAKRVVRSSLKYQLGDTELKTVSVSKDMNQFV